MNMRRMLVILILSLLLPVLGPSRESFGRKRPARPTPAPEALRTPEPDPASKMNAIWERILGPAEGRQKAREELVALGAEAVPFLLSHIKDPDWSARWEAVEALGNIGDARAVDALIERLVLDENRHVRWRSIPSLFSLKDPTIPEKLARRLESNDPSERWNAAVGLSIFNRKEALPYLKEGLKSKDDWVRWEAVNALSRVFDDEAVPELIPMLYDSDDGIRRETVMTLGSIANTAATAKLVDLLDDDDPQLRWRAAMNLGRCSSAACVQGLKQRLAVETDNDVRNSIEDALKAIGALQKSGAGESKQ
jgi:HEAT repeat protein